MRSEDNTGRHADPLHVEACDPQVAWTTGNVAEAIPGVCTPLAYTLFARSEIALRRGFRSIGAYTSSETEVPTRVEDRLIAAFYGRAAANLDRLRELADRLPGTDADAMESQLFGSVRLGVQAHPTKQRYVAIAVRLPLVFSRLGGRVRTLRAGTERWWRAARMMGAEADPDAARRLLDEAAVRFTAVMEPHLLVSMFASGAYEQVAALALSAGRPELANGALAGFGGVEESRLVGDLWELSRDRLGLDAFLDRHGYHGPAEGQVASASWREDPSPVHELAAAYRSLGEDDAPASIAIRRASERTQAVTELLGGLGWAQRARGRLLLRVAIHLIRLREVGKTAYLQAIDGARVAARLLGADLHRGGFLDDPDDVAYLTVDELTGRLPLDPPSEVAFRKARWGGYLALRLPDVWTGVPRPLPGDAADAREGPVTGLAACPGVIEGRARVVRDPAGTELVAGEVLVCEVTDPSWASLFPLASALVVDVGGILSHGAIVARELGLPCVTNTRDGTRRIRTGDLVRVDGEAGTVTLLEAKGDDRWP